MWTSSLLKQNAWNKLKGYYWPALGVTFLATIMGANATFTSGFSGGGSSTTSSSEYQEIISDSDISQEQMIALMIGIFSVFLVVWLFSLAWATFLGAPARCGECKYFVTAAQGDQRFESMFDNFKGGNYKPTVKVMFFRNLYLLGWYCLFMIPGIIKTYEYFLIPYLLAENPNIGKDRAFEISKKTMDGEKMNLFVMQLSFIGWYLLGLCACCVGVYFVVPYYEATMAEFYLCMRAKMISYGITTEEELSSGFSTFTANPPGFDPYNTESNPSGTYTDTSVNPYQNTQPENPYNTDSFNTPAPQQDAPQTDMPDIGDIPDIPDPDSFDTPNLDEPDSSNNPYNN